MKLCLIDNACSNWSRRAWVAKSKRCQLPSLTVCADRDPHGTNFIGASCDFPLRLQSILFAKFAYFQKSKEFKLCSLTVPSFRELPMLTENREQMVMLKQKKQLSLLRF